MTLIKRKSFEGNLEQEAPASATEAYLKADFSEYVTKTPSQSPSPKIHNPESSYHNVPKKEEAKKVGKLPYTEPWDKVGFVISKKHNRILKDLIQDIRRSGNPDFNSRKAIEQALDLLFNVHNVK